MPWPSEGGCWISKHEGKNQGCQYMHKYNLISAWKKCSSFSSPVCRKLTNAEVYYVKIPYIKFLPNQTKCGESGFKFKYIPKRCVKFTITTLSVTYHSINFYQHLLFLIIFHIGWKMQKIQEEFIYTLKYTLHCINFHRTHACSTTVCKLWQISWKSNIFFSL